MNIQSKFRFWAFLTVGLLVLVTGILIVVILKLFDKSDLPPFGVFVFLALFIFIWIWLVFGELRTKVIKVYIDNGHITVTNYFGLGSTKNFEFSEFEGLETSLLPSKYDTYEYLYLLENGKKVVKLSQFYHSNYTELKTALIDKIRNLGQKDFSIFLELKEIFV